MRLGLLLALLTASCAAADVRAPDLPTPPGRITISDAVLPETKICVPNGPVASFEHPWACLTVGELRLLARSKRAL
jgi:hypothetical protein